MDFEEIFTDMPIDAYEDMAIFICEAEEGTANHLEEGDDGYVWISSVYKHNMLNRTISGSFFWGGKEYAFEARSGDWNGFEWISIEEDGDIPDIIPKPDPYTIAPASYYSVDKKSARHLIKLWNAFKKRDDVKEMVRKYSYDTYFDPSNKTYDYYKKWFDDKNLIVVRQSEADEIMKHLKSIK